jgi:hypothetical protein
MFEREMEVCASAVAGVAGQADQGASIDDASGTDRNLAEMGVNRLVSAVVADPEMDAVVVTSFGLGQWVAVDGDHPAGVNGEDG